MRSGGRHYPLVVQSELRERLGRDNIEVISVANSAYATPHSLILLELDVLSWDPDLILISHATNDLTATYFPDFAYDYSHKYSDPYYLRSESVTVTNALFQHIQIERERHRRGTDVLAAPKRLFHFFTVGLEIRVRVRLRASN